jgi:WD40 repeat protein
MSLSSDGRLVAIGTFDGDVFIVDALNQRTLRSFRAHDRYAQVLFLHDGTLMTSGQDGALLLWDPKQARIIKTIRKGSGTSARPATQDNNAIAFITSLAASRDGKRIAFTDFRTIYFVEVGSGRQLESPAKPVSAADNRIANLTLSPDGRRAAWGTWAGDVAVWDVDRGTIVWSERIPGQEPIDHSDPHLESGSPNMVESLSFSPDGQRLAIGGNLGLLIAYDAQTGRRLLSKSAEQGAGNLEELAFLPGGKSLVAGYSHGLIRRLSVPEGEEEFSVETGIEGILHVAASPEGMRIYSLHSGGFIGIYDAGSGSALVEGMNRKILSTAYSPDGKQLATGGTDGVIRFFSIPERRTLRTLKAGGKGVAGLVFSPDGRRLASMGRDDRLRVWISSSTSDAPLWETEVKPWLLREAAFTPDGHRILAGGGQFLDAWDARSGEKLRRVGSHPDNFNGLAVSPDGRYAATSCVDGRIYLWDIESGVNIFAQPEQTGYHSSADDVSFTPDGRELVYFHRNDRGRQLLRISVPDGRIIEKSPPAESFTRKMFLSANARRIHLLAEGNLENTTTTAMVFHPNDPPRTIFRGLRAGGDAADISPDGRFLAIAGDDGVIRIWTVPQK